MMAAARTRKGRALQVLRWIDANWTIGRPVRIVWKPRVFDDDGYECDAWTDRVGRGLLIAMSERRNRTIEKTVDTVIHEAAHGIQWPVAGRAETDRHHHPPSFWAQYGEIRDVYDHDGGHDDAGEFPAE